ncbi:hypothetical protein JCM19240_3216 [Vibrio maritimus]|uniref:Uncharacterized protein n=1 Tax=Vibrio maritimus TaxID=990268 RepID=A0A090TEZ2_9VIBR|nr:hypothetical protein JCM19240_3216 [Vibrio maritimus]
MVCPMMSPISGDGWCCSSSDHKATIWLSGSLFDGEGLVRF